MSFSIGCDPCAGVGRCGGPVVSYEGHVLKDYSDKAADHILVEFIRTGGIALREERISAESDSEGRFQLGAEAAGEGTVVGDLVFHPPAGVTPHRVEGITLQTVRSGGERLYAGRWEIPFPNLPYEAVFYHRGSGNPASGIEIEFRRTGGIEVEPDTFRVTTSFSGTVKLKPETRQVGELTGELLVIPLPPYSPYTIADIRLTTFNEARFDSTIVRAGLGPSLPYAGVLVWEDTRGAAAGIGLEFRRSEGVAIYPTPFVTVTDASGTFFLNPAPLSMGEVEGELIIRSPSELAGTVVARLRLSTEQIDRSVRHLGFFRVPRP